MGVHSRTTKRRTWTRRKERIGSTWCVCESKSVRGVHVRVRAHAQSVSQESLRGETGGAVLLMSDARVSAGVRDLITSGSLRLASGERRALVGANGAGKSTLLRAIAGARELDEGTLTIGRKVSVAYLEQTAVAGAHQKSRCVADEVTSRMYVLNGAKQALRDAEAALERGERGAAAAYDAATTRLASLDAFRAEREVNSALSGLGFESQRERLRACGEFSGGWQMRIALCRLLLGAYDASLDARSGSGSSSGGSETLLLLDEPTNHLDLRARQWLQRHLSACGHTILLVSHDEALLDAVATSVTEIARVGLQTYACPHAEFKAAREERERAREKLVAGRAQEMAKLEGFITRFGAKATKASQAKSKQKQLDKLREEAEAESDAYGGGDGDGGTSGSGNRGGAYTPVIKLPKAPNSAHEVMCIEKGEVGYTGVNPLLSDIDIDVRRGDRLLLVGPNGSGKSTLMDVFSGKRGLWQGRRSVGDGVRVGYFTQDLAQSLPMDMTALDHLYAEASAADPSITQERARATLGALGLKGDAALRTIRDLSGGEKAKVSFAAFVLKPCSLLLLDEPSNHIDVHALDAFSRALLTYDGALVVVSHDREFCRAINPTHTVTVCGGKVGKVTPCVHLGDAIFDKAASMHDEATRASKEKDGAEDNDATVYGTAAHKKAKQRLTYAEERERQKAQRRIMKIISSIEKKEAEAETLEAEMAQLGSDLEAIMEIEVRRSKIAADVDKLTAEWEELDAKYESV